MRRRFFELNPLTLCVGNRDYIDISPPLEPSFAAGTKNATTLSSSHDRFKSSKIATLCYAYSQKAKYLEAELSAAKKVSPSELELREARDEAKRNAERVQGLESRSKELSSMRENLEESGSGVARTSASASFRVCVLNRRTDEVCCAGSLSSHPSSITSLSTTRPSIVGAGSEENSRFVVQQLVSTVQRLSEANVSLRSENSASNVSLGIDSKNLTIP